MKNEYTLIEYGGCDTTGSIKQKNNEKPLTDTTDASGIYKIINRLNGKYYVGSARRIRIRWNEHRTDLTNACHYNHHLLNAWKKYGASSFEFIIVERCEETQRLSIEQQYLNIAKQERDKTYNMAFVAGGGDIPKKQKKNFVFRLKNIMQNIQNFMSF